MIEEQEEEFYTLQLKSISKSYWVAKKMAG